MEAVRKDYRVDVRVTNNNILTAMAAKGFTSVPKFAKHCELAYGKVLDLVNMKTPPLLPNGDIRPEVEKIMVVLNKDLHHLFNDHQFDGIDNNRSKTEVTAEGMFALTHAASHSDLLPEEVVDQKRLDRKIDTAIATLSRQESYVIRKRFGIGGLAMSLEEIGEKIELTGESVRRIEANALRKLRHPSRSEELAELLTGEPKEIVGGRLTNDEIYQNTFIKSSRVIELAIRQFGTIPHPLHIAQHYRPGFPGQAPLRKPAVAEVCLSGTRYTWILYWPLRGGTILQVQQTPAMTRDEAESATCRISVSMQVWSAGSSFPTAITHDTVPSLNDKLDVLLSLLENKPNV